ncbi:MAG: META domain-containing protein [Variovorax sp.]|nr:MAG: META domain-containing protein [Variovorax sp.]
MSPTVRRALHVLPALFLAALMTACSAAPPGKPAPASVPAPAAADPVRVLEGHHWQLIAAFDADGQPVRTWRQPDRPVLQLDFQEQRLAVRNLCNVVGAAYALDGATMKVGQPMSTKKACAEPGLMALEQRVAAQLPRAQAYTLGAAQPTGKPTLALRFSDGSRWQLLGQPTPATRYGSAGERAFFEVAPQQVACNHPLMRDATCLRVRELRLDDAGRKQVVGDWRILQGGIEGYRHEAGIRNVLRVQRYSMARNGQLPADAPSHALVLDMVVESERMR